MYGEEDSSIPLKNNEKIERYDGAMIQIANIMVRKMRKSVVVVEIKTNGEADKAFLELLPYITEK